MKAVQYFSDEYLEQCRDLTPKQVFEFQESFRIMNAPSKTSKLISIRIPENLLEAFRNKCQLQNMKYQAQIKELMAEWLSK